MQAGGTLDSSGVLGVLTSCCAVAGTRGRAPWASASGVGSGTGHGLGWQGWSTWWLAESCGRQAHSTARVHCCGRGGGPQGWWFLTPSWVLKYSYHRSLATPWKKQVYDLEHRPSAREDWLFRLQWANSKPWRFTLKPVASFKLGPEAYTGL